jgi:uncharacterized protein (TIGR02118 family)
MGTGQAYALGRSEAIVYWVMDDGSRVARMPTFEATRRFSLDVCKGLVKFLSLVRAEPCVPLIAEYDSVMVTVSVLYPRRSDSRFDHDYYLRTHVPLVASRWGGMGLVKAKLLRGDSTLDGGTPGFELIALLTFTSREALQAALAAFGSEIIGDISNYTNVPPFIQINQALGN